jgi:hypothetical protein
MRYNIHSRVFCFLFLVLPVLAFSQTSAKWNVNGNTAATGDFLGTTNNQPLLFYTNNVEMMRLKTNGELRINNLGGFGNGFVTVNNNGVLGNTPFTNDSMQVLTGAGTFRNFSSLSPWQENGNFVYVMSCKIGIGTNNPQYKLDVNGNAHFNGTVYANGINLANKMEADTIKGVSMVEVNNTLELSGGILSQVYTKTGDLRLQSHSGNNGNVLLTAGTTGNVGIGIFSPQYKFDVFGDARISGSLRTQRIRPLPGDTVVIIGDSSIWFSSTNKIYSTASGLFKGIAIGSPTSSAYGKSSLALGVRVWTASLADYAIVLGSGATNGYLQNGISNSLMIGFNSNVPTLFVGPSAGINTIGRVGIGTTDPRADFQVGDHASKVTAGPSYGVSGTNGSTFSNAYVGFNVARVAPGQWETQNDGGGNGGVVLLGDMGGGFRVIAVRSTGATNQAVNDQFIADNTKFYVRNDGRVIIGSETMVNGSHDLPTTLLTVDGTAICRELFVTQNNWADSIFKPEYNLIPLDSVQNYVSMHGHLPGVPSEQEVKQNGSNLGQTDVILLTKIEELTLYMLQLQKQNAEMQKELDELKKK